MTTIWNRYYYPILQMRKLSIEDKQLTQGHRASKKEALGLTHSLGPSHTFFLPAFFPVSPL